VNSRYSGADLSVAGVKRSSKDKSHFHESSYIYSNSTPHARSVLSTRNDASGTARLVPRVQGRRQWMGQRWSPSCACGGVARRTEEEEGSRRRRGSSSSSRRPEATNRPSGPRLRVTLPRRLLLRLPPSDAAVDVASASSLRSTTAKDIPPAPPCL